MQFFSDVFLGVIAAIALQDKKSGQIIEVWWDGTSSNNIIVNTRSKDETKNKEILKSDTSFNNNYIAGNFNIAHEISNKKLHITHENYIGLKLYWFKNICNLWWKSKFCYVMARFLEYKRISRK